MSGACRANGVAAPIPTGSRKLVQSLREIVHCPEPEIYAMLRECNMDPNEAVHRLLGQDTFHEVKSKRDKKREIREPPESRSRTVNGSSGRGTRVGTDRGARRASSQSSSTDYGTIKGKPNYKKENGTNALPKSSLLESATIASSPTQRPTSPSKSVPMGNVIQSTSITGGLSVPMQSSSVFQNSWLGKPGHVSMADIVKMGKPQSKPSSMPVMANEKSYMAQNADMLNMSHHKAKQLPATVLPSVLDPKLESCQESTRVLEISHNVRIAEGQHNVDDGWSLVDGQPMERVSTAPEISDSHLEEIHEIEESLNVKILPAESTSTSVFDRQIQVDTSKGASHINESLLISTNSYSSQRLDLDHHEGSLTAEDVILETSSDAADLSQLRIHETSTKPIEDSPAVIIPNHLRVTNADCAYLSFGSFGSGAFAGSFPSKPLESNLEVIPVIDDASRIANSDARNESDSNRQLKPLLTENVASRSDAGPENLDEPSTSQPEMVTNDPLDTSYGLQYNSTSESSYAISINGTTYTHPQGNTQMQSLSRLSSLMQQPNTLQNSILAASIPYLRDFDLPLSPLLTTQSIPTKYSTTESSISGSKISMPEALKPGVFSDAQSTPQTLPSTTMLTSILFPQNLPVHHYSQPALPLGHFANMISYPFLPHGYAYLPSVQQAFTANSPFHQSTAAVPSAGTKYSQPQYRSSLSVTSLPQASAIASAYGGFGSLGNIPGGYNTTASTNMMIGLDEALSLQYKEASRHVPLQQSGNPAMWIHGVGSRTMAALPASTFYNYPGQNQHSGFRQTQQSSHLGALGYPNLYHAQAGASHEHQQNLSDSNMSGSQTMQSQPTNQIWQHGY
ncbi:hypothetical protein OPV22_014256 [Ensete ventricosum]|uniref:GBF-interacting protein 1 N-terminal domain-containing protein n=1 Tax=Ensete ventricosum TaxID=4639 RepID=A0AAV8RA68_ENSVE|nr:hypothetical protein OPV22_014256 [Ensete ventricosum]